MNNNLSVRSLLWLAEYRLESDCMKSITSVSAIRRREERGERRERAGDATHKQESGSISARARQHESEVKPGCTCAPAHDL